MRQKEDRTNYMNSTDSSNAATALVTGASRGIGAAIFAALGGAGARVLGTATSEAGAQAISDAAAASRGAGVVYRAGEGVESLLAACDSFAPEGIDVVVANAAVNADSLLIRMDDDKWNEVINTNLTAVFQLTQPLIRKMMKKRYGRVIFITSVVASVGNAGQANYCAAKAGVEGYCRAVAKETASRNITVNAIAPGFIQTDMTDKLPAAVKDYFLANIPMGRAGTAADVAAAVQFLASEQASYITGQVLHVNGGLYLN